MELSVVIPTYNRSRILRESLASLYGAVSGLDAEIIVVNDSKTSAVDGLPAAPVPLSVVANPGRGPSSARNYGAKRARGRILLFMDDDILVGREAVLRTLALHDAWPDSAFNLNWRLPPALVAACRASQFGRYLLFYGLDEYRGWVTGLAWENRELFRVSELAAFNLSIERRRFELAGGFDESFRFQGAEDTELSRRFAASGLRLFVEPAVYVQHNESDHISLASRLERTFCGGCNRRVAADRGLSGDSIRLSRPRFVLFRLLLPLKGHLYALADLIPNRTRYDPFYRALADKLTALALYEGYFLGRPGP